ncbi:MAG: RNA-binding protein, partial [Rhizobiales bacterium]|nr:RNA-binding protein [Hyphomicrobiales bacterium]
PPNQEITPTDAAAIRARLDALVPRPYPANRAAIAAALQSAAPAAAFGGAAWLSNGLGGSDAEAFGRFLDTSVMAPVTIYGRDGKSLLGLAAPVATADALTLSVLRGDGEAVGSGTLVARDMKGRSVSEAPFAFKTGEKRTDAVFTLPAELRNEIVRVEIAGQQTAGAVQLLDDRFKRRRIGLISGASSDNAQPLLSPLYYISRAVQPFADVIEPRDANAALAVPQMIEGGSAVIAMADIGTLTPDVEDKLATWVEAGGTLLRFAGPRLAAASAQADNLIPVRLREGGRVLGGSLSWSTPQPLASFSANSPFAGLAIAPDIEVRRQVLAEPDANLPTRTWAALADGTPLVTAAPLGKGWLILFHVTADSSWSNLPLSGTFVEMLRRISAFASVPLMQDNAAKTVEGSAGATLPP